MWSAYFMIKFIQITVFFLHFNISLFIGASFVLYTYEKLICRF